MSAEPLLAATERHVRRDFRGSSRRILADRVRRLPPGARIVELGVAAGHLAAIVDRRDLAWLALEADPGHIGELHRRFSGAAIVDVQGLTRWLLEASGRLLEVVTHVFPKLLGFQLVLRARRR